MVLRAKNNILCIVLFELNWIQYFLFYCKSIFILVEILIL